MFGGGIVGMLIANLVFGAIGWKWVYLIMVAPAIVFWMLGTGVGILWYMWLVHKVEQPKSLMSTVILFTMFLTGVTLLSGGLVFLAMGIQATLS